MSKIKLNLMKLTVESFEIESAENKKGTVGGNAPNTAWGECRTELPKYCPTGSYYCDTQEITCPESCNDICNPTNDYSCQVTCPDGNACCATLIQSTCNYSEPMHCP